MRPSLGSELGLRAAGLLAIVALGSCAIAMSGCTGPRSPKVSTQGIIAEATETIPATATAETTAAAVDDTLSTPDAQAAEALAADPGPISASGIWPVKVATFATSFGGPVWYPKTIPAGYKLESLDIAEVEPGSGPICEIIYTKGESSIGFTQGSPTARDHEFVSAGRVPWGTQTADLAFEDPADKTSPQMIVYLKGGNFAELYGDASTAELKAMAASMVPVK